MLANMDHIQDEDVIVLETHGPASKTPKDEMAAEQLPSHPSENGNCQRATDLRSSSPDGSRMDKAPADGGKPQPGLPRDGHLLEAVAGF